MQNSFFQSKYFCVSSSDLFIEKLYRELILNRLYPTITFIFFLSIANIVISQQDTVFLKYNTNWNSDSMSYTQDTIFFEAPSVRNYLFGTTVLNGNGTIQGLEYGLELVKVTKSQCQNDSKKAYKEKDKIISIVRTDSTIIIDVNINSNCCFDFLCEPEIINKNTLNLKYTGYGPFCSCNCCFGLVYHFKLMGYTNNIDKLKFITIGYEPSSKMKLPQVPID